ncbi:helix-turn-helix domain-containing protein [Streptomyces sp. NPDC006197]|uniref:helix-turn-helix domain-containing protein n=1 Tax=Streptomyces sp. NPDC006197 TaxID=3156685 RepID=UPI00339EC019
MNEPGATVGLRLADKLNHLFHTVTPGGRRPYSTEEVARSITLSGVPISASYIWLLRKGHRDNPTLRHVEALAQFFGVPPNYFFESGAENKLAADLRLMAALKDTGVQAIALRASGLSAKSLDSITEVIQRVRELEGLAECPDEPCEE